MNTFRNTFQRYTALVTALVAMAISLLPAFNISSVASAAQVSARSIQMSDSTVSATGTSYKVTFTPQTAGLSLVIDFCQDSAIIGATCTTTRGVTFTGATISGSNLPVGFTTIATTGSTVKIAGTTNNLVPSTAYTFTVNGVNNPTGTIATAGAVGSFYARIYTYANNTYGTWASGASPGNYVDYGGFALSTAANVSISATVMETLTFCVSKAAPGAACTATSAPTLTLGHGVPLTLDSTAADTDTAYTQLSSNANSGVAVNLYTTSSGFCSGLSRDAGATCGISANSTTSTAITAGLAKFGLKVSTGTGGTGTVSPTANYGGTNTQPYMGASVYTTPDAVESSSSATANVNSLFTYTASAATVTPAGVYSTTEALIATGTF